MDNLNQYVLDNDGNFSVSFQDNSIENVNGISLYLRDLEPKLLALLSQADAAFGAVAWLTSENILNALSRLRDVSIIVQKEDFLRPDLSSPNDWKRKLRDQYARLNCGLTRYSFHNILNSVSVCGDPTIEPVRCVGNHNRDKAPAFPRMHNKFLVLSKILDGKDDDEYPTIAPYGVWTGSFNFTYNATQSLENALYITVPEIVDAYFREYGQIAAMSEPLDWESEWIAPEWRIGT